MDQQTKIKDIIQWDLKAWSKPLHYWDERVDWQNVSNCLEIGGREGGLSLWLALKDKKVLCSDLYDVRSLSEKLHIKHNVTSLVSYENMDATNIPYENEFDLIVFKSVLGSVGANNDIEKQKKVFKEIYKALKPGGYLLFAENLIASPFHQFMRNKFTKWGSKWRYVTVKELEEFLATFSEVEIKTTGVLGTFGRNEKQRNVLSTIDNLALNKISPKNWHYVSYGMARKV